jgi:hypothetical protein
MQHHACPYGVSSRERVRGGDEPSAGSEQGAVACSRVLGSCSRTLRPRRSTAAPLIADEKREKCASSSSAEEGWEIREGLAVQCDRGQCGMCSVGMQQEGASASPPEALSSDGASTLVGWLTPPASHRVYRVSRMQSGACSLYTLPSHQESER